VYEYGYDEMKGVLKYSINLKKRKTIITKYRYAVLNKIARRRADKL